MQFTKMQNEIHGSLVTIQKNRTEQNIYFIDLNSTVSRHTYFDITKDSYKVTLNVYMDLTTKL